MFRLKICGITHPDQVPAIEAAGVDAIGLNFYEKSSRYLNADTAAAVANAATSAKRIGVFVNAASDYIRECAAKYDLHAVQLHGDESPEFAASLGSIPLIRAWRFKPGSEADLAAYLQRCRELGVALRGVLIDAYSPQAYGGTGATADWERVRALRIVTLEIPLLLAGGLRSENVAEAIAAARPDGIDTAGGVESAPGVKDLALVRTFVEHANAAFRTIGDEPAAS